MIWACEISSGHSWYKVLMNLSFNQLIYLVHVCSVCCSLAVKSFQSFRLKQLHFSYFLLFLTLVCLFMRQQKLKNKFQKFENNDAITSNFIMFLLGTSFPIGFIQMNVLRNCQEICIIFDMFSLKWALWIIFRIFFRLWVFPASVLFLKFCLLTACCLECLVLEKSTLPDKIDWNFLSIIVTQGNFESTDSCQIKISADYYVTISQAQV